MKRLLPYALFELNDTDEPEFFVLEPDPDYFRPVPTLTTINQRDAEHRENVEWEKDLKTISKALSPTLSFKSRYKPPSELRELGFRIVERPRIASYIFGTSLLGLASVLLTKRRSVTLYIHLRYLDDYYYVYLHAKVSGKNQAHVCKNEFKADGKEGLRRLMGKVREWLEDCTKVGNPHPRDIHGNHMQSVPKFRPLMVK
jgi:hypothetical protein